jgi:putative ABC transport system permease protein
VLLASWGLDGLLASLPDGWLPRADEIALNRPVLVATLVLTVLTGLAAGLAPGVTATRNDANDALKDNSRSSTGPSARRLRAGLVVGEIALALVLLASTGLLGRSFVGLLRTKPGLEAGRVLSLTVSLPASRYSTPPKCWDFFSRAETGVAALPGVEAAGFTHTSPFRWGIPSAFAPVGANDTVTPADLPQAFTDSVSVDFFKALGIPLRAGRTFTAADDHQTRPIVVLNETAARRYFGSENPVGRFIAAGVDPKARFEVVGVVGDVRRSGLTADVPLQVYRPLAQRTPPFATLMVRTALPPTTLAKAVQAALWRIDPDIPISDIATMETFVSRSVTQPRLYLVLFTLFAVLALLLAAIGLYGLIAHGVEQRTREFGIRAALGAGPHEVLSLVLKEGAVLITLGIMFGLTSAFAAVRLLQSMIFGTSLYDPTVFLAAPLLLSVIAVVACWIPARRATKVDPMIALRAE